MANLKKRALGYLSQHSGTHTTLKELARHIKVGDKGEYQALRTLMDDLERRGIVGVDEQGRFGLAARAEKKQAKQKEQKGEKTGRLRGRLGMTRQGFGFVQLEDSDQEIFIGEKFLHTALHGDIVEVVPFARPVTRRGREGGVTEGEVVKVLERTLTTLTGVLQHSRKFAFVVPDDERISRDIYVSAEDAQKAEHGDKVVVELLPWADEHRNPEGTIIEVLGPAGDPRVEVASVARNFNLPLSFPEEVEREAATLSGIVTTDLTNRLDYRNRLCFTIDPEDAKDFDDAISYEPLEDGGMRLGVHIADVSHYVREGTALDREAFERGTSVYLVNGVIPMLPERLSNDLCSLRPDTDRLTYSVIMDVSKTGTVDDYTIQKSVIHSARRFTYEEVQEILQRGKGEHAEALLPVFKLSQMLLKRRRRNGSIDFDTGETKFRFDTRGLPTQIIKKERLDSHRLVEECMLLANRMVAEHIGKVRRIEKTKPFIYRVHDVPDPSRLLDLANFVKGFGYSFDPKNASAKALQQLLDSVAGSEVETVINEVALRSMAKAVYSEKNIGHFGLAFHYYTHFTSPIRRYPDLIVHRLLNAYAAGVDNAFLEKTAETLPYVADHSSERERVAVEAERMSVKVMQVEYMKRHLGDEFDGVIAGVTKFGLFVEINELLVEGLVPIRDLADDYYIFDEKRYSLRGRSRGKVYRLGDPVRVRVVSVNPEEHQIEMVILD